MGLRFIIDEPRNKVALYCSTTGIAFGPVLDSEDEAEAFVAYAAEYATDEEWLSSDPRNFTPQQLDEVYKAFVDDQAGAEDPAKLTRGEGSSASP